MSELQPLLSPAGQHRRREILQRALAEARGLRRRRVITRVALAGLVVALLVPRLLRVHPPPDRGIVDIRTPPAPVMPAGPPIIVTRFETDPHIVERLAIAPPASNVVLISDTELLDELALANRPAGLAYVNGKATLLFR